jgi:hypothetical protein
MNLGTIPVPPLIPGSQNYKTIEVNVTKINNLMGDVLYKINTWKGTVRVTTTEVIDLSGLQTIDGVVLIKGDRVLVKDQTNQIENGIYIVNQLEWQRSDDLPDGSFVTGVAVFTSSGTTLSNRIYVCINESGSDIVGINEIIFTTLLASSSSVGDINQIQISGSLNESVISSLATASPAGLIETPAGLNVTGIGSNINVENGDLTITAGNISTSLGSVSGTSVSGTSISSSTSVTAGSGSVVISGNFTANNGGFVISTKSNALQTISITNSVTTSGFSGVITTFTASAATGATQTFVVNNTNVTSTSCVFLQLVSYAGTPVTDGIPLLSVSNTVNGSFSISIINFGASSLNGVLVINYLIV